MNFTHKKKVESKNEEGENSSINSNILTEEAELEKLMDENPDTEEVPLVGKINDDETTAKINFQDQSSIDEIIASKTIKSEFDETKKDESKFSKLDAEDIRSEIKNQEGEASKKYTYEDFSNIASFLLTLYDTGLSTALRVWCKDSSSSAYEMPKDKKRILEHQLTLILIKYQQKFSLEFMFFATLLIISYIPFSKARERKKGMKVYEEKKTQNKTVKVEKFEKPEPEKKKEEKIKKGDVIATEDVKYEDVTKEEPEDNPFLRKRGKPRKGY